MNRSRIGLRGHGTRLLAFAVLGAALAFPAPGAEAAGPPFQRGVTVGEWGPTAYAPGATRRTMRRLASRYGADTVTLFVVWEQQNARATRIGPHGRAAPVNRLVGAIRAARRAGMRVTLRPYLDRLDGGWRGQIAPTSIAAWFRSYERFVMKFARLAQANRVSTLVVGSEMVSISDESRRWRRLVARVKGRFHGRVTYQANWDEAESVTWWDALDLISISGYFPLSQSPLPSVQDLVTGWRQYRGSGARVTDWVDRVRRLRERFRKRVIFGEIGYRTISTAAAKPWDIGASGARSTRTQANAYEAAFRVWYRVPWFRGFNWWYVTPQPGLVAGQPGADHRPSPAALAVLRRWYGRAR